MDKNFNSQILLTVYIKYFKVINIFLRLILNNLYFEEQFENDLIAQGDLSIHPIREAAKKVVLF